jgi:hypothetical protein
MQKYPEKPKELIEVELPHTSSSKKNIGIDEKNACYRSFITSSAQYLLERFSESHVIRMDLIRQELFQRLEDMLSDILIDYIDRDLKTFRHKNSLDKKIDELSPDKAIKLYKKYFEQFNGGEKYWLHMKQTYPEMRNIFDRLTQNFTKSTELLIKRVESDYKFICIAFLGDLEGGIKLTGIKLTDSDLHKDGQQVAILEFTDSKGKSKKLIYKPSPVQSDALIFGNMEKLQEFDPQYTKCRSMLEIFNKSLSIPLPKYLIAPRKDKESDNIVNHYGYMEYLQHNPWHHINFQQIAENALKNVKPNIRTEKNSPLANSDTSKMIQFEVDKQLAQVLYHASQENCDYITHDEKDIKQYSFDCGVLMGLIQIVGLADIHCENLIISNKRPMLIDGEICCTFRDLDMELTNCFEEDSGAMIGKSSSQSFYYCLVDVTGKIQVPIKHLEKNLLFLNDHGNLVAYSPTPELFLEGFKLALQIIKNDDEVLNWYKQPQVQNMIIRVIPKNTGDFKQELDNLKEEDFKSTAFEKLREQSLQSGMFNFYQRCKIVERNKQSSNYDPCANPPALPHFIIYSENNAVTMYNEYKNCCVPQFFTIAGGQDLLNYKAEVLRHESKPYFPQPPIMLMAERAVGIKNEKLINILMENANKICLLTLKPDESKKVVTINSGLVSPQSQKHDKRNDGPEEKCLVM